MSASKKRKKSDSIETSAKAAVDTGEKTAASQKRPIRKKPKAESPAKKTSGAKTAPKAKATKKAKGPGGRPPKYREGIPDEARKLCAVMGATDEQLAEFFDVKVTTIDHWKQAHPEFLQALKDGKDQFDTQNVEQSLLHRALGYEHPDVHVSNFQGEITVTPITKRYAPDTTAAIFWLKNRQRDRWRDKQDIDHGVQEDNPLAELIGAVSGKTLRPTEGEGK